MKFLVAATTILASIGLAVAYPAAANEAADLEPRTSGYSLAKIVSVLKRDNTNAYSSSSFANGMIKVNMSTTNGGSCSMWIGATNPYTFGTWNACYQNGVNQFNDWDIGSFAITFTQAGSNYLQSPVLQVTDIDNNANIKLDDYTYTSSRTTGNLCQKTVTASTGRIEWICGIPEQGDAYYQ